MTSNIRPLAGRRFSAQAERTPCQAPRPARRKYAIRQLILPALVALSFAGCGHNPYAGQIDAARTLAAERPDSALSILQGTRPDRITRRRDRAEYALLYTSLQDRCYVDVDNDSLLRHAVEYYRSHYVSDSVQYAVNYCLGRIRQNGGEYEEAINLYLQARDFALPLGNRHINGLVNTRLGEIYTAQLNFRAAIDYHKRAFEEFSSTDNPRPATFELINIGGAYLSIDDLEQARDYLTRAKIRSERYGYRDLTAISLGGLAHAELNAGNYSDAKALILEGMNISDEPGSLFDYSLLADIYLECGNTDSAAYCLSRCGGLPQDDNDRAMLHYRTYRLKYRQGDYRTADAHVERFIEMYDSIVSEALAHGAMTAERNFHRHQSEIAAQNIRMHKYMECTAAALLLGIVAFAVHFYRQRMRIKQLQIDSCIAAIENIRALKDSAVHELDRKDKDSRRMRGLLLSRFAIVEELGMAFYERGTTRGQQEDIYKRMKQYLDNLASDEATIRELDEMINAAHDNLMSKLTAQFPRFKPSDIALLRYVYAGFSAQIISLLTGEQVPNIYARKSRLKRRIADSDAPDKELFISAL